MIFFSSLSLVLKRETLENINGVSLVYLKKRKRKRRKGKEKREKTDEAEQELKILERIIRRSEKAILR